MRRAFRIDPKPSAPLTVAETAKKYRLSNSALKDTRTFVARYVASSEADALAEHGSKLLGGKAGMFASHKSKIYRNAFSAKVSATPWRPIRKPTSKKTKAKGKGHSKRKAVVRKK